MTRDELLSLLLGEYDNAQPGWSLDVGQYILYYLGTSSFPGWHRDRLWYAEVYSKNEVMSENMWLLMIERWLPKREKETP